MQEYEFIYSVVNFQNRKYIKFEEFLLFYEALEIKNIDYLNNEECKFFFFIKNI